MSHRWRTADKNSPAARARAKDYNSREHRQQRARWQQVIDTGHGQCHEIRCIYPSRTIPPGSTWHLAHAPDRSGYLGPAHPQCNLRAAARAGNAKQRGLRPRDFDPRPGW